jgi:hypothetical protein
VGVILALLLAAVAVEPPPEPDDADAVLPELSGGSILVWSEVQIREAREEVIRAARAAGYTQEIRRGDRTILRHAANYRGEIVLFDDGRMEVKRQPIQFEPPIPGSSPARWLSCVLLPLCVRPGGQLVSQRRFRGYQREALAAVEGEVHDWNERIGEMGLGRKIDGLPDRLEALWRFGVPLDGGEPIGTIEGRKAALLEHWDTRVENTWGDAVRRQIEAFVRAEIQDTAHGFTPAEIAAFNATRRSEQALSLQRGAPADVPGSP